MKKTVLMNAAKKARIALAVMALCGMSFVGAQEAFAADPLPTTDLPVKTDANKNIICGDGAKVEGIIYGNPSIVIGSGNIAIGEGADAVGGKQVPSVAIGLYSETPICCSPTKLGDLSSATGWGTVAIGGIAQAKSADSSAFGAHTLASGQASTVVGWGAMSTEDAKGSVALGYGAVAAEANVISVGIGDHDRLSNPYSDLSFPIYRRIVNMADGMNDHDAATVGQVITNIKKNGNTLEFYTGKGADGNGTKKWEFDLAAGGSTLTQEQFNTMLDANTKFTGLQTEVGNKANANGDNITTGAGSKWAENLGTGAIANGDKNLVNGETVYNKIGDTSQLENANLGNNLSDAVITVNTKAETALNKATDNEKKIGDTSQLANVNLGNNLSDAVVKVNDKVGDTSKLTTANLGNNLSDAVVKVDEKTKQNAKDIEKVNGRVDELGGRVDTLGGAVSKLDTKVNKVGAGAAALAALHPMDFDSDNKLTFAAGVGSYHGASAAAIGAFYRPSEQVMFSISGNMGNGENMVNAGVSFALDRPSKTPTTKTALVKTVAAQNEQIAALSETVAEQNEKIARLEAMVEKLAAKQNA